MGRRTFYLFLVNELLLIAVDFGEANVKAARKVWTTACDGNFNVACRYLARLEANGKTAEDTRIDPSAAIEHMDKACKLGCVIFSFEMLRNVNKNAATERRAGQYPLGFTRAEWAPKYQRT